MYLPYPKIRTGNRKQSVFRQSTQGRKQVLSTLFASTALDGTVWTFPHLVERVIQNNTTTIFPMCITLIAGYIIAREKSDDTLKSIMTIPVSYPALIGGKLKNNTYHVPVRNTGGKGYNRSYGYIQK